MLQVDGLQAGYGRVRVLFGIDLAVAEGEVATLLGRNGMGKTTTMRAITGLTPPSGGQIAFRGHALERRPPHAIGRLGIAMAPEGRQVFPTLTVRENLVATAANRLGRASPWTLERIYRLFPRLQERQRQSAASLSGGEQQMLAIGRALMTNPALLLLDEATEGLAPLIRQEIYACIRSLKAEGQAILMVDKHIAELLPVADRHTIIEKGRTVWSGSSAAFRAAPELVARHLGV